MISMQSKPNIIRSNDLNTKLQSALNRMRDRMANLETTLGQTASENQELRADLSTAQKRALENESKAILATKALLAEQKKLADMMAQLDVYRRKTKLDQQEIEALKTQLFA